MSQDTDVTTPTAEQAKRRQILDGARRCFLAMGYEAASMGTIAREAGVSKGTLYVYFTNKEDLFRAMVEEAKRSSAERMVTLPESDDAAEALVELANDLILRVTSPEHVALMRMVAGAADRFPAAARSFFEAGPVHGHTLLRNWLERMRTSGRMDVTDTEEAAWQFLALVIHHPVTRVAMGCFPQPDAAEARRTAEAAVQTFLRAYPFRHP